MLILSIREIFRFTQNDGLFCYPERKEGFRTIGKELV